MNKKMSKMLFLGCMTLALFQSEAKASDLVSPALQAVVDKEVLFEQSYEQTKSSWITPKRSMSLKLQDRIKHLTPKKIPLLVHILWNEQSQGEDLLTEPFLDLYNYLPSLDTLKIKDRIHFIFTGLNTDASNKIKRKLKKELYKIMKQDDLKEDEVVSLLSEYEGKGLSVLRLARFRVRYHEANMALFAASNPQNLFPTKEDIRSLVEFKPYLKALKKGLYQNSLTSFVFCRTDRSYPCRMVMKDAKGEIVRNADGTPWNTPNLAKSAKGLAYNQASGNTPSGVYSMDSVMPATDTQISYGKFRRVILNFIPAPKKGEIGQKQLMPEALLSYPWWRQALVARDVGRALLRIHGTGRINQNPLSHYYTFVPSNGCLKTREGTYKDVTYIDQRLLLDTMMESLDLEVITKNETKIRGLLYVVDLDNEKKPVEMADLEGIID